MEEKKTELNAILRRYAGEIRKEALAAAGGDANKASRVTRDAMLKIRRNYLEDGKTQYGGDELADIVKALSEVEGQAQPELNASDTGAEESGLNGTGAESETGLDGEAGAAEDLELFENADETRPVKKSGRVFARVLLIISIVLAVIMLFLLVIMLMERGIIPKFVDFGFADWFNEHIFKLY